MIRQLRGSIAHIDIGTLVLDIGGVGYQVAVSAQPKAKLGDEITLHTHLAVRETALDLYGFETRDELEIFELLLTIPKIGPKSALQVLSQADIELLKQAVLTNDASYLSKLSGIGKKTAEKIVSELSDSFSERFDTAGAYGASGTDTNDVIDALVALGYPLSDVRGAIKELPEDISPGEAVKQALRYLGKDTR